ncbi:MAG: DNA replication and repair protein RecF [Bacteroidetes bacterium]|nr:DNA replication and repair protein RecF [Bacteroidota bacterium]
MLGLGKITLTHFKNYEFSSFEFPQQVTGICGLNGRGKTNLLDAIYYCCFTKSYFTNSDALNVHFNKEGFRLEAAFYNNGKDQQVVCIHRGSVKKEFLLNGIPYEKLSAHIGLLPVVMIAPDDIELITGTSESRRRFIDTVMSQVDAAYLLELIHYNKILQQRNSLLKKMDTVESGSATVLDILDEQLIPVGSSIHSKRKAFLQELIPLVQEFYQQISNYAEKVSLEYISQLNHENFEQLLKQNRQKDILLQRSNAGVHKDDAGFLLNGQPFKSIASQGQRKSLLFALKLAEFELLKRHKGFSPLLLLDDVFEKLDAQRMNQLLHWVCNENSGKVFITDTHRERLESALEKLNVAFSIIEL